MLFSMRRARNSLFAMKASTFTYFLNEFNGRAKYGDRFSVPVGRWK